jgi:hypothetical protein
LPEPEAGETLDPALVNVVLSAQGQNALAIPRVSAASACGDRGWYYDSPDAPTRILLCPGSCEAAQTSATLDIALGCETIAN